MANARIDFRPRHPELENPGLQHKNRLDPRSNLIPAQKAGVYYKNKEESAYLQSLNGEYRFLYREQDCVKTFFANELDDSGWDTIDVPSMWQYRGYGKCTYPNTNYAIPFNPPYVCCPNPVGYYRRHFRAKPGERTILHFGGVDNAFYVYLNGGFVGFSKGSRNPAEFDVTHLIKEGDNLLAVKVFTYSDATYLECQDMLFANGIFRDVYLLHTKKVSLWDYRVTTDLKGFFLHLKLTEAAPAGKVEIAIGEEVQNFPAQKTIDTYFAIENPKLWNSEEPNLYDLEIRLLAEGEAYEMHSKKIGMLHSEIRGEKLLVNGMPVYLKGVNRHEYDCDNGRAISVALIEKELKLIKENNINAVRCSHYTNHPAFYEICSEIGLFVMDEADLESHGCDATGDQGYLSKRKEWLPAYMDRVERMLKQNKNEACIFMYSMGNECGQGQNQIECMKYTMAYEPDKVAIHDQQRAGKDLFEQPRGEYDNILRAGYRNAADTQRLIDEHPISMQIEYGHAMGNSPGFLEGYQKFVYENESYLGGFVWEFKNHGFHRKDEQGRDYYLYGGDFGDKNHWYNFCLDGYLMSDGTPKHSWYELGQVFAPVYVTYDGQIRLKNTFNFRSLDTLTMDWELKEDYRVIKWGSMQLPKVEPHGETLLTLPGEPDQYVPGAKYFMNLYFYEAGEKEDEKESEKEHGISCSEEIGKTAKWKGTESKERKMVGSHQMILPVQINKTLYVPEAFSGSMEADGTGLVINGKDFRVRFENGLLCSYRCQQQVLLDSPLAFNLYRAPTDNDGILGMENPAFHRNAAQWNLACLDTVTFAPMELYGELKKDRAVYHAKGKLLPLAKYYGFEAEVEYSVYEDGLIKVDVKAVPYGTFTKTLPRIGLYTALDQQMNQVTWYGRGDRENYSDCKKASPIGLYSKPVQETYTIYDMPQETGNHENTSYVIVSKKEGENEQNQETMGLAVIGCDEFAFSCHDFTLESLTKAVHKNEVKKSDRNYLYIDYKMRGLGSNSCGPEPEEEFELRPHAFEFVFVLAGNITQEKALAMARKDFGSKTQALEGEEMVKVASDFERGALL